MLSASKLALSLLIASTLASAADICAFTSRGCSGNYGCWHAVARLVAREDVRRPVPHPDGCGGLVFRERLVFNGPGWVAARAAAWDADTRSRRRSVKFGARADDDDSECMEANVIGFTKDGTEHRLRIPEGTKFADAEKLLNDGQFDELFKFESVAIEQ
ncbi:unnamed protein product [Cyclocybe aegerita]|uniref:Uncharacterized protein n=1 Tax=Cyclocybe aegerita TaxID=1973307 RepID=A0A8S0W0F4_CYCAE|nr:unnamed protein product [Cyclocybe aegerita]